MYKVVLNTSNKKYTREAKTVAGALSKMGLDWHDIKAKGVLKISQGRLSHTHVLNMFQLRRIFGNKLARTSWGKNLEFLTKSGKETNLPKEYGKY